VVRFQGRTIRRLSLILGIIGTVFTTLFVYFVFAFARGYITPPIGWLFVFLPLVCLVIAFKWTAIGGVLLILESLALIGVFISAILGMRSLASMSNIQVPASSIWRMLLVVLIFGLLLLASGILFIIFWRRQKRGEEQHKNQVPKADVETIGEGR